MSIVPLLVSGTNPSIVRTESEHLQHGGLNGSTIMIQNIDETQLNYTGDTNASYDLRIGSHYIDHRESGQIQLDENDSIVLLPGMAIIVETEEIMHFPVSRFGYILPKVSLLQNGISNTSSKIDPGYRGTLLVTIFNIGKKTVKLKRKQKFCTLIVHTVLPNVIPYSKPPKTLPGARKVNSFLKIKDWVEKNQSYIAVLAIVATLINAIILIIK